MIPRAMSAELKAAAAEYPVVTVLGPRQSGKTTLVRTTFGDRTYVNLEEPDQRARAIDDPRGFLAGLPDGGILDEIQHVPELLSYIQGIVDERSAPGRFLLTGSHQPALHQAVSQSLAGRTAVLTLLPLSAAELRASGRTVQTFEWLAGGAFPRLHEHGLDASRFFNGYIQTHLERDVRALIQLKDLRRFQAFLVLLAGRTGQLVNYASLAGDVGVSATTIKDWISVLVASYIVFDLPPYFANIGKRLIKAPKLYFTDTGLCAHLMGIRTADQAARDPLRGALFENAVVLEVLKHRLNAGRRPDLFFYRDSNGTEVDLLVRSGRAFHGVEIKSAATFTPQFVRGLTAFRAATGTRGQDAVLYGGAERLEHRGVRVFHPFVHDGVEELAMDVDGA